MDARQFLTDFPDLTPILGQDEDAKQDVLLRCWQSRDRIVELPRFARRVAKNRRIDEQRRRKSGLMLFSLDVPPTLVDPRPTPLQQLLQAEGVRYMLDRMKTLPRRQREVIGATMLRGETSAETAARLGRTPGAVRSDLWRAREAMKNGADRGE